MEKSTSMAGLISCYPFKAKLYYMCVYVNDEIKCKHSKCLFEFSSGVPQGDIGCLWFHFQLPYIPKYYIESKFLLEFTSGVLQEVIG